MPGGPQHKLMTRLALEQMPECAVAQLGGKSAVALLQETCCYPDAYFDVADGGHAKAAPYALLIEGIQFHYLPNSPIEGDYKFWSVTTPDAQGRSQLKRMHREPNRNWSHAWTGFSHYLGRTVECLRAGQYEHAAGFLGTLLHVLQDAATFIHSLEGPEGLDVFALDRLITPPNGDPALLPSVVLAGRTSPCELPDYIPRLLGTSVPEAAFRLYSAYATAVEHSRRMLIPMLSAIYESRDADADLVCTEMLQTGARLCADVAFTIAAVAAARYDLSQERTLEQVCLSELEPVSRPRTTSQPYGLVGLTRDCALDAERQRRPLALVADGTKRLFRRGFGSGTHFDCAMAFELPAGVYRTVTCWAGAHAELSTSPDFRVGIRLRGDTVQCAHITADASSCHFECDVSGGGLLELFAESDAGLGQDPRQVNSVVWGDLVLQKLAPKEMALFAISFGNATAPQRGQLLGRTQVSDRSEVSLPRLRARNVLLDVDGTITESRSGGGDVFRSVLEALVAAKYAINTCEARQLVQSVYDPSRECVSRALQPIGVSEQEYLAELLPALGQSTCAYADAEVIELLYSRGFLLFPATTNSGFAIRAKLACDGTHGALAECFGRLLGGTEVHPEGKSGPGFYRSLIDHLGIDPSLTVMVGDDPKADLLYAREAGISATLIVRRSQPTEWTREGDGGLYIRTLALLPDILELAG